MSLTTKPKNITLDVYKQYTNQEFLKGDENYFSIIYTYYRDYYYNPKQHDS